MSPEMERTLERLRAGDARTMSRAMTWVENGEPQGQAVLQACYSSAPEPWVIGVTGVGGAGKSSLLPMLAQGLVDRGSKVLILAIDPSSPFTGGALLGDRIRTVRTQPAGVFFRSLGSRGAAGGISGCVADLVRIAGAAGRDAVIIETVGAGQSEFAIRDVAHSVMLVAAPGLGDDIQASKAGILEIVHLIAVNKADRPGAAETANHLRQALRIAAGPVHLEEGANPATPTHPAAWLTPVVEVSALSGLGLPALMERLYEHREHLAASGERARLAKERARRRFAEHLRIALFERYRTRCEQAGAWQPLLERLDAGQIDPMSAANELLAALAPRPGQP